MKERELYNIHIHMYVYDNDIISFRIVYITHIELLVVGLTTKVF